MIIYKPGDICVYVHHIVHLQFFFNSMHLVSSSLLANLDNQVGLAKGVIPQTHLGEVPVPWLNFLLQNHNYSQNVQ